MSRINILLLDKKKQDLEENIFGFVDISHRRYKLRRDVDQTPMYVSMYMEMLTYIHTYIHGHGCGHERILDCTWMWMWRLKRTWMGKDMEGNEHGWNVDVDTDMDISVDTDMDMGLDTDMDTVN